MQNGYLDSVPVEKVKQFQLKLQEYLRTRKESLLDTILRRKRSTRTSRPSWLRRSTSSSRRIRSNLRLQEESNFISGEHAGHPAADQIDPQHRANHKAMQMVAASKMRKAQQHALAGRPYAD